MNLKIFYSVFLIATCIIKVSAQEKPDEKGLGDAATNAVNPVAFVTKLQIQPNFTWKKEKARQINLTNRIFKPSASIGLPFIKSKSPSKFYTIYRLELPLIGQTFPSNPEADGTGLGDIALIDLMAIKKTWGLIGAGPALIIPTVNPASISGGKWCAGIACVAVNTKTKGLVYGASIQQFVSFAGSSHKPSRNFMLFTPTFNKILGGGYFVGCSPAITFDWEKKEYSVPMIISYGKVFAKNLSAFIAPQYMLSGPSKGDFTLQFQINAMFPPGNK
jgi:hypothetical protein